MKDVVEFIKSKFNNSLDALNDLNLKLVGWYSGTPNQRFGQYLESVYDRLVLPVKYYETYDSYEVFGFMCDCIDLAFGESFSGLYK